MSDKPLEIGERVKRIRVGPDTACHGCTGIVRATGPYFSVRREGEFPGCYDRDRHSACPGAEEYWQRIPEDTPSGEGTEEPVGQDIGVGDEVRHNSSGWASCEGCRGVVAGDAGGSGWMVLVVKPPSTRKCVHGEGTECPWMKEATVLAKDASDGKEELVSREHLIGKMVVYEGRAGICRGCKGVVRAVDERDTAHVAPRERADPTCSKRGSSTCPWPAGAYSVIDDAERKEAQMSDQQMRFVTYSVEKVAGEETKDTGRGCETLPRPRESILPKDGKEPFERIWTDKTGRALREELMVRRHHEIMAEYGADQVEFVEQPSGKVIE